MVNRCVLSFLMALVVFFVPLTVTAANKGSGQEEVRVFEKFVGDYDEMVNRRVIRALVPYSKTFYFLDMATAKGLSYETLMAFEKGLNAKLKTKHLKLHVVFIPTQRDRLLPDLEAGLGDLAVGNLTITDQRLKRVDFSDPMLKGVDEVVVSGAKGEKLVGLDDLAGREIHVRRSSSYYESLLALNETLKKKGQQEVRIKAADEHLEDEDLLEMVNAGLIPMIVMESHKARFWQQIFPDIAVHDVVKVNSGGRIGWAMHKKSPQLKKVVNEFVKKNKKGTLMGNMLFKRYLQNTNYVKPSFGEQELKKFDQTIGLKWTPMSGSRTWRWWPPSGSAGRRSSMSATSTSTMWPTSSLWRKMLNRCRTDKNH